MNSDSNRPVNPPIFTPANDLCALLFALLPCVSEPFRPFFTLLYLLSELSAGDFQHLRMPPRNLPAEELLNTVFLGKDTLLRSLSFYGSAFQMPFLSTLANLFSALQFYNTYRELFSGFSRGHSSDSASNAADPLSGLFSGASGMSPELLQTLLSLFSSTGDSTAADSTAPNSSAAGPTATDSTHSTPGGSTDPNSSAAGPTATDSSHSTPGGSTAPDSSAAEPADAAAKEPVAAEPAAPEGSTPAFLPDEEASGAAPEAASLFDSLFPMLTPRQQEIYDQLMKQDRK